MTSVVVGTAGHIDHGKSAIVRALTGIDPDRLKEEQTRGITIDLGFAHFTEGDRQVALVDVPGHERFVRNMLAGAGGIDAVLLVVAANESVRPQTREHFEICRLLGVERGVIALTKADLADATRLDATGRDVRELVTGSFLEGAPVVAVSARTGAGLDELRRALVALAGSPARQHRDGIVRLPVDRAFTMKGHGPVATGTLVSGALAAGDTIAVLPASGSARVRGLHVHGQVVSRAAAPRRVAVNLAGVDLAALSRGVTLGTPGAFSCTRQADVRVSLLAGARTLAHGARVRVHQGSAEAMARVSIGAWRARAGEPWEAVRPGAAAVGVPPAGEGLLRLRLAAPMVLTRGDRLVLRAASPVATIGGARVLDPEPPDAGVRRPGTLARLEALATDEAARAASAFLADAALDGLVGADLVRRGGRTAAAADADLDALARSGAAIVHGGRAFAAAVHEAAAARVLAALAEAHAAAPGEAGPARDALRARVGLDRHAALWDAVLAALHARRLVTGTDRLALATHRPATSEAGAAARAAVEASLRHAALTPPDQAALAASLGLSPRDVTMAIQALTRAGRLVSAGGLLFHVEALEALKKAIHGRRDAAGAAPVTIDIGDFKTQFGLTRKHAIPLLEWLDRARVTRRVGEKRIVL